MGVGQRLRQNYLATHGTHGQQTDDQTSRPLRRGQKTRQCSSKKKKNQKHLVEWYLPLQDFPHQRGFPHLRRQHNNSAIPHGLDFFNCSKPLSIKRVSSLFASLLKFPLPELQLVALLKQPILLLLLLFYLLCWNKFFYHFKQFYFIYLFSRRIPLISSWWWETPD